MNKFPDTFRFGVADADLQVIGETHTTTEEHSQETLWTHFAKTSGKVYNNDTPESGIDRYHKWSEDVEIMRQMGVKHYRASISMARLLNPDGSINSKALTWYKNYFKTIKQANIAIYATLYHWELPYTLYEKGGWLNRDTILYFQKHVTAVFTELGEYIDEYFLINEPWCIAILSYYLGQHAPGHTNLKEALQVGHNILVTIGESFKTLHALDPHAKIGTVFNSEPAYAFSTDSHDILAAAYGDESFNRWFMDPLFLGKYPEKIAVLYGADLPVIEHGDMETMKIGAKLHAFAFNYYCGKIVKYNPEDRLKFSVVVDDNGPKNSLGWPIFEPPTYPNGLYDMLNQVYNAYKDHGLKRIYITENGLASKDIWDGKSSIVDDSNRVHYLQTHLKQIYNAILHGIPVEAYFSWTFMDNYEWGEGYKEESRFGLIYVDRPSMKRVWKKSAHWYKQVLETNSFQE